MSGSREVSESPYHRLTHKFSATDAETSGKYNPAVRYVLLTCLLMMAIGAAGCVQAENAKPASPLPAQLTAPAGQPVQPATTPLSFNPMDLGSVVQLDVVIKPRRAAEVVLSPVPLASGGYIQG